jgi:hypothetical protein
MDKRFRLIGGRLVEIKGLRGVFSLLDADFPQIQSPRLGCKESRDDDQAEQRLQLVLHVIPLFVVSLGPA